MKHDRNRSMERRGRGLTAALAGLVALASPAFAKDRTKPPEGCSKRHARPANPNGSVLMPVRPPVPASLLSDEILPTSGVPAARGERPKRKPEKK